ncbi:MAG: NAD(P)H-dependent oxidoreductase [Parvibaculaceae bacterium]
MKVFIVYAHLEPKSFNAALLAQATDALAANGAEVRVSDLHAMNFDPVVRYSDFKDIGGGDVVSYYDEQKRAYEAGRLADDIAAEIEKIKWCDLLILQFPLYWFSVPAILKGWIDRVLVPGFAFGGGKWYEKGGLVGKRAMLATTMAAYPQMIAANGINGLIDVNLWPIQNGVLAFCGFDVLKPFVANSVAYVGDEARQEMLRNYATRLVAINEEVPMHFHRRDEFDRDWKLKPGVAPRTVGHYFASLPPDDLDDLKD